MNSIPPARIDSGSVDGEWLDLRADEGLSGHQPLPGAITRPEVAWRHYLGGGLFDAHTVPLGDRKGLLILFGGCIHCYDIIGNLIWKSVAMGFEGISAVVDLDNDGRVEIVAGNGKTLFVLSADNGAILWSAYLGPPAAGGFMHTAALVHHFPAVGLGKQIVVGLLSSNEVIVYDCSPGAANIERLHALWMDDFFHPSILAVDIDGDGHDEIVITKYSAIYAFDPKTGESRSVCRWSSGGTPKRNYGLFLAQDLTGSGAPGFVVLSERVSKHLSVIANDGQGNLSVLWDRFLEHIYPVDRKELRYSFNSLCDIDGDGRLEIVVSFFDEENGGAWWLEVIDAVTGECRQRIENLYLHGIQNVMDDEPPMLCVTVQSSRLPSRFGSAEIWQWENGELRRAFVQTDSAFAGRCARTSPVATTFRADIPPTADVWTIQSRNERSLLTIGEGGQLSLITRRDGIWACEMVPAALDVRTVLLVEDLDGDGNDEIVIADDRGEVRVIDRSGESLGRIRSGMRLRYGTGAYYRSKPMQTPVVALDNGRSYIAVPDGGSRVHLLSFEPEARSPKALWALEGRGRCGPEESIQSVTFRRETDQLSVVMSAADGDVAALVAVGLDRAILNRWTIDALPAAPPYELDRIGIHDYRFVTDRSGEMLVISGYRSTSMNSEETCCVDAADGRQLWRRVTVGEGENGRGFGPWNAMSVRRAGGRALLQFLAKDTVCSVDARSGEFVSEPWQLRPWNSAMLKKRGLRIDDFAAYGSLFPCDVDGDGRQELVIAGAYGGIGVIGADGEMLWWQSAPLSTLSGAFPGLADIDGDGLPEIGMGTADGDFVVLRADTGLEKWRLHIGEVVSDVISCDIDGDGAIEFVMTTQQGGILCLGVGSSGAGRIKWRLDLGYSLGPPVAADIDGDGRSELLVVSGDGSLYAIRGKQSA